MIWAIAFILALSWSLGVVADVTLGGLLHVLLVGTGVLVLLGVFRVGRETGRRQGTKAAVAKTAAEQGTA
jgi:hypothetical protein